jgi:hypothetical protein
VAVRNALLDAIESAIGASPKLRLRTGAPPANAAAASTGTVIAEMTLPADWMANASGGTKALSGSWQDASADATGTVGHFEIVSSDGSTRHLQGTVTANGGGGDITLDNVSVNAGQSISITSFNLTAPNA